jgi:hypothetical protein
MSFLNDGQNGRALREFVCRPPLKVFLELLQVLDGYDVGRCWDHIRECECWTRIGPTSDQRHVPIRMHGVIPEVHSRWLLSCKSAELTC